MTKKGGTTIKIAILEGFLPKTYFFITNPVLHTLCTRQAHPVL
jgi:hypothetical protein